MPWAPPPSSSPSRALAMEAKELFVEAERGDGGEVGSSVIAGHWLDTGGSKGETVGEEAGRGEEEVIG